MAKLLCSTQRVGRISGCCNSRLAHPADKPVAVPPTPSFTLLISSILTGTICADWNTDRAGTFSKTCCPGNGQPDAIRLSETLDAEPAVLLEHVCRLGIEGIVGKNLDQPYRSGRTGDWVKVKCVQSEPFFIVGYEMSSASAAGFGSLVLAAYRGADLVHVGSVGTGFRQAEAIRLRKMLDTLRWKRKQPPLPYSGSADIVWVAPTLIAEIEFRAWTTDGKLRHPSYKGLRERQDNADVFRLD